MGLTFDPEHAENVAVGVERQEEKKLLGVRHKSRVTSLIYVPEIKELISSGTDDMLFMFTSEGVITYTTGKFKRNFDFMVLVQRPHSSVLQLKLWTSSN